MYKFVAMDIDDTLLTDELQISEGTKLALHAAAASGVHLTLATGRMFASAKQVAEQLELSIPIITYQGSLIKQIDDDTSIYERFVPPAIVTMLFDYAAQHRLHIQTYIDDRLYVLEDNSKVRDYARLSNVAYSVEPDISKLKTSPAIKIVIIDDPQRLDEVAAELKPEIGSHVHITKSKPHFLEFMHPEGNKGSALAFLADLYGCSLSETIAFGDSWNDREMIQKAGLGVAMGNAVPELKVMADYITASNNEDGIKQVIDKFILQGR